MIAPNLRRHLRILALADAHDSRDSGYAAEIS